MASCQNPGVISTSSSSLKRGPSLPDNMDRQAAELEVLLSMFGEDLTMVTENQEFRVAVHLDSAQFVKNLQLLTPFVGGKEAVNPSPPPTLERQVSTDGKLCYPVSVTFLPPLTLCIAYHDRYPSERPPYFDLHAQWLDRRLLPRLRGEIDKQFTPGCEFVYDLVEYLCTEFLPLYLTVQASEHVFLMSDESTDGPLEGGGSSGIMFVPSSSVVKDLEEYDCYRRHEIFLREKHLCDICTEDRKGEFFPESKLPCGHLFCSECLGQYCETKLNSGGVGKLHCPTPDCSAAVSLLVLRAVLNDDLFERYERLLDEFVCDTTPGVVYCPRPGCRSRVFSDPDDSLAVCDMCRYPFCKACNGLWHGEQPCKTIAMKEGEDSFEERLRKIEQNERSVPEHKKREMIADLKVSIWSASNPVRKCPRCGYLITKDGGCNKMSCAKCGSCFCWICGQTIGGYSHFDGQCPLFRTDDYQPPPKLKDVDVDVENLEDLHVLIHPKCPKCDMENLKDYMTCENFMTCVKCHFRYCFVCLEPCFGEWHFNEEYGCKRYTKLEQDTEMLKKQRAQVSSIEGM